MQNHPLPRRAFLKLSVGGVLAAAVAPALGARVLGANERVRVAVLGIHGMGQTHIREYMRLKNVEVAALCEPDENLFSQVTQKLW